MTGQRSVLIFNSVVDCQNSEAVARLLAMVPSAGDLQPLIQENFMRTVYDSKARRDYWIAGNGKHLLCLMIAGIAFEEAPKIRALLNQPDERPLTLQDIASLTEQVTGGKTHLM